MVQRLAVVLSAAVMLVTLACAQTDPGITTAVKSKLAADDTVKAYQIDVTTQNGIVTLTGRVDTAAAKEQAVALARRTDGVRNVVDQLTVGPSAEPTTGEAEREGREAGREARDRAGEAADRTGATLSDGAITTTVKSKFLGDTTVSGLKIDVDTKDGVVTLNGTVGTRAEADRAVALARATEGVKRVVNNLHVGS